MDSNSTNKVEVIAAAIDGDNLVLETIPHKDKIRWPLNNLPRPLEIGSRLTLELKKDCRQMPDPFIGDKPVIKEQANTRDSSASDEKMRKLLEALVN